MDSIVRLPGTNVRLGLDALLGLIPIVGDVIGSALGAYVVAVASRLGVPRPVLARMTLNLAVDAIIGFLPLVGDLFDVAWRANTRNVALLERALAAPRATSRASVGILVGLGLSVLLLAAGGVAFFMWLLAPLFVS